MVTFLFVVGLIFLIVGAEALVRGASWIAAVFGISPLIIGLTVVAFGTSSPELAVSIKSTLNGQAAIALGNVIGSNIFNVLFILGLCALIIPLNVEKQLIRIDVPLIILISVAIYLLALDQQLGRFDGILLLLALVAYITYLIVQNRRQNAEKTAVSTPKPPITPRTWLINIGLVTGGLALLVTGSGWLVDGAIFFARSLGVSEMIIGLTIIAAGTSLPEVVTSVIAALRGERDIAVGNVVGSNLLNMMAVLGVSSTLAGIPIAPAILAFDLPIMIAVSLACLPIFFTGSIIGRFEGALLFGYYIAYTLYLILAASQHDALTQFSGVMLYFVIPLTAVILTSTAVQEWRARNNHTVH